VKALGSTELPTRRFHTGSCPPFLLSGTVTVAVGELANIERWYEALLAIPATPFTDDMLGARGVFFAVGPHILEFVTPTDTQSPLVNWLREFGPSPYAATLKTAMPGTELLDLRLAHGANLSFGV